MKRIFLVLTFILVSTSLLAQIPRVISYQGLLLGSNEQPVPEGNYKLTFKIYDDSNNLLWTEAHHQVFVSGGLFHVMLGTMMPLNLLFDRPYFLGLQVGSEPELQPRMLLTSAAYSLNSDKVGGFNASKTPQPNVLVPLGSDSKFPASVWPAGVAGNFIKKDVPDTSRSTSNSPMLLVSNLGNGDGINSRSKSGIGLAGRSDANDGITGWTGATDKSGVFGFSVDGYGLTGRSDNKYAVFGASKTSYGGFFRSDNDHFDLALGGPVGRLNSDPNIQSSVLYLSSNHDVIVKLDNDGGEQSVFRVKNSGGADVCTVNEEGDLALYDQGNKIIELGMGLDYAEGFDVTQAEKVTSGTVLVIDADHPGRLTISTSPYDRKVAGIVAGAKGLGSGVRLGAGQFDYDVALAGRVYCNVDASYGEVRPGDLLTTSPSPGYAMVVKDHNKAQGAILGKAMEKLRPGKKRQILVLVTLQ